MASLLRSDGASWDSCDGSGAELSHGGEDAHHVGRALDLGSTGSLDVGVLAMGVLVMRGDQGEKCEVTIGHLVATNVSATVSEVLIQLGDELFEEFDASLASSIISIILHQGVALRLLKDVNDDALHPGDLIVALGSSGHVAVLEGEHLENGHRLGVVGAIVLDKDGHLGASTVSSSLFHGSPFGTSDSLVFEVDSLGGEHETNGLGATLNGEVNELGHLCVSVFSKIFSFVND